MNALVQNARRDVPVFKHFTVVPSAPRIGGTIEGMHLSALNPESAEEYSSRASSTSRLRST